MNNALLRPSILTMPKRYISIKTFLNKITTMEEGTRVYYTNKLYRTHLTSLSQNTLIKFNIDCIKRNMGQQKPYEEYVKEYNQVLISCLQCEMSITGSMVRQRENKSSLTTETEI